MAATSFIGTVASLIAAAIADNTPGAMPELLDDTVWLSNNLRSIGCVLRAWATSSESAIDARSGRLARSFNVVAFSSSISGHVVAVITQPMCSTIFGTRSGRTSSGCSVYFGTSGWSPKNARSSCSTVTAGLRTPCIRTFERLM